MTTEQAKYMAKIAAHFHQALLVEGVDIASATVITGNFILYLRAEILEGTPKP